VGQVKEHQEKETQKKMGKQKEGGDLIKKRAIQNPHNSSLEKQAMRQS